MKLNRDIITPLYRQWKDAEREVKKMTIESTTLFGENMVIPQTLGSDFVPREICDYINANSEKQHVFRTRVGGRPITFYMTVFEEDNCEIWVRRMLTWLSIGYHYSKGACANELAIYIYFTPFEKHLPRNIHDTIGPSHVNTGVALRCSKVGEIVIYRKEEWFKVFIHETFHSLGLDLERAQVAAIREKMMMIFPIASDHDVAEAYTETWARIIHTIFVSFSESKGIATFEKRLLANLSTEREHSLSQMHKLLHFIGVPYETLRGDGHVDYLCRQNYREKSNVFAYYVICGMLLNDPNAFMEWCQEYNSEENVFNFGHNENKFVEFIRECSCFMEPSNTKKHSSSTKMTILEIN